MWGGDLVFKPSKQSFPPWLMFPSCLSKHVIPCVTTRRPAKVWMTAACLEQQGAWPRWAESSWSWERHWRVTWLKSMPCTGQLTPGEDEEGHRCFSPHSKAQSDTFVPVGKEQVSLRTLTVALLCSSVPVSNKLTSSSWVPVTWNLILNNFIIMQCSQKAKSL